jgi:WD40 repeat protein
MNDPIFTQLPENSELSLPTTQQNGNNSRLAVEDLHRIIETAIARYWAQGVKIQTPKDLTNLEKVHQVVNDFFQHQSTALGAQHQTYFEILQGLYQEFTGNFSTALNHYQAAITQCRVAIAGSQQIEDKNQEKWILSQTAHCYFLQAYWEKDLNHPAWQNTRHYLSQSLQVLAADNWQNLRDDSLTLIGKILRGLEDWEQLKAVAESFLNLYYQAEKGEHQDPKNLGLSLPQNEKNILSSRLIEAQGFLGECFIEQWQFEEAKIAIQRALNLYHQSPDRLKHFHSWLHYLLGRVQMGLKEDEQAINLLESAKESIIFEADPQLYLAILIELRYCYCKRQDAIEVLAIDQLYQALEYRMGKRAFIGLNPLSSFCLLKLIHPLIPYSLFTENERDSGVIPTEISHSERIQDLQTIQSLISDRETRILIFYGDRGIGKTSLIQSGLIPNLDSIQNFPILIQDLTNWQFIFKQQLHLFFSNHGIANDDVKSVRLSNQELFKDQQILLNQLQQLEKQSIQVVVIIDSLEDCFNLQLSNYLDRTFWQFLGECFSQTNLQVIFCTTPDYVTPLLNHFSAEFKQNAVLKQIAFYQLHPFSEEQAWQVIQALSHKTNFPLPPDLIAAIIRDLRDRDHQINCRELQILGTVLEDQKIKSLKQYQIQGKDKFIEYYIETILKNCGANDQKIASICLYLLSQFNQSLTLKNLSELKEQLKHYCISITLEQLTPVLALLVKSGLIKTVINNQEIYYCILTRPLAKNIRNSALILQHDLASNSEQNNAYLINSKETLIDRSLIDKKIEEAQQQLEDAQTQYQNVLIGIRLERQSLITLKQFESQQIDGLLLALKAGKELQQLLKEDTPIMDYPSISPLLTLQTILSQIYERNRFQQRASITDLHISPNDQLILTASSDGNARIWDRFGKKLATLKGHSSAITGVRWSRDGNHILTASADQTARLWSGKGELVAVLQGHQDWVRSAEFSPDHQWIVTASRDGTVRLWDLLGEERSVFRGHQSWVRNAEFSPNSQYVLTASKDGTARLWNLRGQELLNLKGHQSWVRNAHFSQDGQLVVTASADGTAKIWDLSGKVLANLQGHQNWVRNAEFNPTGDLVVTASADGTARIWDLSGKAIAILQGHQQGLYDAHFSPNGQFIVTTSPDRTARLWNRKGKALVILRGHQQDVYQAEFSHDSHRLVTVSADRTARLWDLSDKGAIVLRGHTHWVRNAHFNYDGSCIVTTSRDKTARLWDNQGKPLAILEDHQDWVRNACFSSNGQLIATASADKTAQLWSITGKKLTTFQGHHDAVLEVQFSLNGQYLVTASKDKTARVWTTSGRTLAVLRKHQDAVYSASFSPDGQFIVTASGDGTACIWDIIGREMATCTGHEQPIYSAQLSADNEFLVTASADKTARVWDITGKQIALLAGHHGMIYQARFSPDEHLIVTASADKTACIWGRSGQKIAVLYGHQALVSSAEWSPDGQLIVTASEDGTARLWDRMGRELATLQGHQSWVRTAEFSPDGRCIITASTDGTARIWQIDSLEKLMNKGRDWLQDYLSNNAHGKEAEKTIIRSATEPSVLFNREGEATVLSSQSR